MKALTEHVPFTCSSVYELFIKVLGTMGGRRVRGASVTGTVMTVPGLISERRLLIGDLTRVAEVSNAWHCLAMRAGPFFSLSSLCLSFAFSSTVSLNLN